MSQEGGLCAEDDFIETADADPAVRALVSRVTTTTTTLPPASVSIVQLVGERSLMCLGELDALAILAAGRPTPLVSVLASFKVGFDLGKCFGTEHSEAVARLTRQSAVDRCAAQGGESSGFVGDTYECVTVREVAP